MNETSVGRHGMWLRAVACSVALHAIVVALCLGLGRSDAEPVRGEPGPASTSAAASKVEDGGQDESLPPVDMHRSGGPSPRPSASVPASREPASAIDAGAGREFRYTVRRGDTLSAIAKRCGCSLAELATLNGETLKKLSRLDVGQVLVVPVELP